MKNFVTFILKGHGTFNRPFFLILRNVIPVYLQFKNLVGVVGHRVVCGKQGDTYFI